MTDGPRTMMFADLALGQDAPVAVDDDDLVARDRPAAADQRHRALARGRDRAPGDQRGAVDDPRGGPRRRGSGRSRRRWPRRARSTGTWSRGRKPCGAKARSKSRTVR